MANLITRAALKAYLFGDFPNKDRFKQRVFPLQSDRPTEQTFENFVDTVATIGEVEDLSLVVATKATMTQVTAALVPYSTTAVSNTLYAAKSYESRVAAAEVEIDALQAADLSIPTNYYNKTQSDARFAAKSYEDRVVALEGEMDIVSDLAVYQENKTKKRIDVEHFTWKPLKADDTYYLPFHPSSKVIIKSILIANVSEWVIYPLNGATLITAIVIDQTNNTPLAVSDFNNVITSSSIIDGILIVARTLNPINSGGLQIPPSVNLRVEYQYP